jgi:hypothetical protein
MEYGYDRAKMLWSSHEYACRSITKGFWLHVKNTVFHTCHSKWPDISEESIRYFQDCKTGAERFTIEQMNNCFSAEECKQVGSGVAAMIAVRLCNSTIDDENVGGWMPAKCAEYAHESCHHDAYVKVQEFAEAAACNSTNTTMDDSLDGISGMCQETLSAMEEAAKLT